MGQRKTHAKWHVTGKGLIIPALLTSLDATETAMEAAYNHSRLKMAALALAKRVASIEKLAENAVITKAAAVAILRWLYYFEQRVFEAVSDIYYGSVVMNALERAIVNWRWIR